MSITLNKQYAPCPKPERGVPKHIHGDPKEHRRVVYCAGQLVMIRDIENPLDVFIYRNHKFATTSARMTPSGFYVASADERGNLFIWDTVNDDHIIKLEKQTFGPVLDMAFSPDSKRLCVAGRGRGTHAEAFFVDSGASVGQIINHMKPILSIDYRQDRPFRIVTGSEDMTANFYAGPPFKLSKSSTDFTRFVTCVRFSPNGAYAVAVATDKKIVLYDGKTFDVMKELPNAHNGGIYGVSWSPDSSKFLTASADKTCKIWSASELVCETTFTFGKDLTDQQLGCLWDGDHIISINLQGDIQILDQSNPQQPSQVIRGHNVCIEAMAYDQNTDSFFSGDRDGRIICWSRTTGHTTVLSGAGHKSRVVGLACSNGKLVSVSFDDTCKVSDVSGGAYDAGVKLPSQPTGCFSSGDKIAVITRESVCFVSGGDTKVTAENKTSYQPTCVTLSKDTNTLVVGGDDKKVHVYTLDAASKMTETRSLDHPGSLCSVAISDEGLIVAGDASNNIIVWDTEGTQISKSWSHRSRVDKVRFSPDGKFVASASLDSTFCIWDIASGLRVAEQRNAQVGGVKDIFWVDQSNVLTCGQDAFIQSWTLNL